MTRKVSDVAAPLVLYILEIMQLCSILKIPDNTTILNACVLETYVLSV
jgi:hypothetical protein